MTSHRGRRLFIAGLLLLAVTVAADNLACNGTGMDWYTGMVGETPCTTYQKLRQICNSQYTVGIQNVNTPPDACTDQLSSCCCNNVAFALSMLCLNCQQNIGTGTGFDAGTGAYGFYLGTCSASRGLPKDIQTAVCNQGIKINDDLYGNGWGDGAWFYVFTRDTIIKDNLVANNNSFTHCASTTVNHTSSSLPISQSRTSASSSGTSLPNTNAPKTTSSLGAGPIAGIAIGGLAVVVGALLAWFFCFYKRRQPQRAGILEEPLGGRNMRQRDSVGVHDQSLVPTSYPYSNIPPTSAHTRGASDYFGGAPSASGFGPRSEAGGSSSPYSAAGSQTDPGFAGIGVGAAAMYNPYDTQSTSSGYPLTPRRRFHTAGQTSSSDLHVNDESPRPQAGLLPRKRPPTTPTSGERWESEEPFLEADELDLKRPAARSTRSGSERHLDAGPVDVSLSRSASGRLPPAYGDQL
ncbi:hypothetical protein MIND_00371600 [Mycena indigotica]|uniref:Uncharacterized protein n=1 Tax=Mycena indigotica TaxID=2126181 RepID=A0A8H6T1L7_9AGAR|nr:uncharacterized protein MIND_00371600 [Mycena indigotica]KAF7309988.1 hypothetical protein MIND_00371600 [Mycena indigotica]